MTGDRNPTDRRSAGSGAWLGRVSRAWVGYAPRTPLSARDRPWLGLGLAAGLLAAVVYLATNPYPAYGAGLYTRIAEEIIAHGYGLPATVEGYTADGVPFAYPPLQFYVLAVLLDLGVDPITLSRFLPSVATLASLVPTYLLARDYTDSRPAGAAAAVAVALNPQLVQWHLSAGGVVRAFAFCYAMAAIYAGYHVFAGGSRRAVAVGLVAFAATLLSHPTYALFVVVSYLLCWGVRDRSVAGLGRGAVVGVGGLVLAAPWLAWVVATHGPDAFLAAAGTHGGVGGGVATVLDGPSLTLLPLAGAVYLFAVRRDRFLVAWALAAEVLFAQPRFSYVVGSVVLAAVAVDLGSRLPFPTPRPAGGLSAAFPAATARGRLGGVRSRLATVGWRPMLAAALLVTASLGGGAYLTYEATLPGDPSTPAFVDGEDVAAADWVAAETPSDATFVVVGDAAEWLPALTGRTLLVGPWGVEWKGPGPYERQLEAYESLSRCQSADCVERTAGSVGADPEYVYLPRGRYTVRGEPVVTFGTLERSFERSASWERVHENEGVVVFRAT